MYNKSSNKQLVIGNLDQLKFQVLKKVTFLVIANSQLRFIIN